MPTYIAYFDHPHTLTHFDSATCVCVCVGLRGNVVSLFASTLNVCDEVVPTSLGSFGREDVNAT